MPNTLLTSVTRIADLGAPPFAHEPLPFEAWSTGDYVVGEALDRYGPCRLEAPSGRRVEVVPGDLIVGALGRRFATLQIVGDWRAVGPDLKLDTLTIAGVLGRCTSFSVPRPAMVELAYRGHVWRAGEKVTMRGEAERAQWPDRELSAPVLLIIGTSMEAGKTLAAKTIVRRLRDLGLRVGAVKLTGVGRYRDVLAMGDAGADPILDFVDAGLPSTINDTVGVERALRRLVGRLAAADVDVVVAEAGASPLEPYHGEIAVRVLGENVACTVLCASDPYAVVGVMEAFDVRPDLVSGRATSTEAGIALVDRLTGLPALNMLDREAHPRLDALLRERLGIGA